MSGNAPLISVNRNQGRRLIVVLLSLVMLAIVFNVARDSAMMNAIPKKDMVAVKWGFCIVWVLSSIFLLRQLQALVLRMMAKRTKVDVRVRMMLNRLLSALGYSFVVVEALHLLQVQVVSILVGGALTGVIVGIAAQSTLSNLFAGIILFTLRPFSIGQTIIIRSSLFGGIEYSGTVLDVNWFHTLVMNSNEQRLAIPNSTVVAAVVTIISNERIQTYTLPLPYSVSIHDFTARLREALSRDVSLNITDFGDSTYSVQVRFPIAADRDVLRRVLAELKR